jgi:hypothetical protein
MEQQWIQMPSVWQKKIYKAAVVLPNSYTKSKANFPSCTCFGAYGHFNDWLSKLPIKL